MIKFQVFSDCLWQRARQRVIYDIIKIFSQGVSMFLTFVVTDVYKTVEKHLAVWVNISFIFFEYIFK